MFDWVLNTPLRRDPVVYEILWSLTSLVNKDHTSTLTHTMLFPLKFNLTGIYNTVVILIVFVFAGLLL